MRRSLCVAAAALFLSACSGLLQLPEYAVSDVPAASNSEGVLVNLQYLPALEVNRECSKQAGLPAGAGVSVFVQGCAILSPDPQTGNQMCTVIVVKPKGFNEHNSLMVLGHEVWHCFGARHE